MTIVTSSPNPFLQSPRGPQKKPAGPVHQSRQVLFGRIASHKPEEVVTIQNGGREPDRFYRQNGLFVTNERLPVKTGGLGEVAYTITQAMAKYGDPAENGYPGQNYGGKPRDMRVVVPYLQQNRIQDNEFNDLINRKDTLNEQERQKLETLRKEYGEPFQPTNATIKVKVKDRTYEFQVLQAFEPALDENGKPKEVPDLQNPGQKKKVGTWVYALKNDALFSNTPNIATYDAHSKTSLPLLTPFNEAAGKLVPLLEGKVKLPDAIKGKNEPLQIFPTKKLDFVVGNDWLTGPTLYQDGIRERDDIHKIFYMHNSYDSGAIEAEEAGYDRGMLLPKFLTKPDDLYSQLTLSLRSADAVVANRNFVKTLTQTDFGKGQAFVPALKHHLENGTIFDMHHGLDPAFRPDENEFLRATNKNEYLLDSEEKQRKAMLKSSNKQPYEFQQLDGRTLQKNTPPKERERLWEEFKSANKRALQTKYGLEQKDDAIVMSWAARLEPNQKGFYLVQHTIEKLLEDNPKLQILIAGNIGDPAKYGPNERMLDNWIKKINQKYGNEPGKNRVYIPNSFVSKREITQMNAGSDFTILPSLYEPYGLTQLEAMMMGSKPVVNGVDGNRTTVSDPTIRLEEFFDFIGREGDGKENVWDYGQTGVVMQPFDMPKYREAIMLQQFFNILRDKVEGNPEGVYRYSPDTKEDFKKIHKVLVENEARFADQPETQKAIQALATRMAKKKETTALRERDLAVLDAIEAKDNAGPIKDAQDKFTEAMERAIKLTKETERYNEQGEPDPNGNWIRKKTAIIREKGFQYLKDHHNWETIIKDRYFPLLDAVIDPNHADPSRRRQRGEKIEFAPPTFQRTKNANKFSKPSDDQPQDFLSRSWANFKGAVYTVIYYLNVFNWFKKPGSPSEAKAAS